MRITLIIVCGFLLIAGGGLLYLMKTFYDDVERQYSQAAEEPLIDFAHLFASLIEEDLKAGTIDPEGFRRSFDRAYRRDFTASVYKLEKTSIDTGIYVTDAEGIVLFDSDGGRREGADYSQYNDVFLTLKGQYGARSTRLDPEDSRSSVFFIAAPIYFEDRIVGSLTVHRPETAMAPFADETRKLVLQSGIYIGAAVLLLGAAWAYWWLHPIRYLTRRARSIADGEAAQLPAVGHAELRVLSRTLEEMRAELEGRHYVEQYVQALTHELKSPLAAIRGAAELLDEEMEPDQRDRFVRNILAETGRTEDLVRRLVQLAALENQSSLSRKETIDLTDLLRNEIEELRSLLETKRLRVDTSSLAEVEPATIQGDPLMLGIAFRNLLKNAIDFSPPGGTITVDFDASESNYTVGIRDEGPGIPDYAMPKIFDRFYSLKNRETGRKSSGIGLSFVKEAIDLHGGRVELRNLPEGGAHAVVVLERFPN